MWCRRWRSGASCRDKHGAEVLFVGTARGLETKLVPEAGFRLELVRSGQLKNVSLATRLKTMGDLPLGVLHCMRLLGEFRPQVVVGVGGYASGPAMIAAVLKRIPTLAYEPNAVPGMTNRLLGKRVSAAAVNFAQTAKYFRNAEVTGVPVRPEIFELPVRPAGRCAAAADYGGLERSADLQRDDAEDCGAAAGGGAGADDRAPELGSACWSRRGRRTRRSGAGLRTARWRVEAFLTDMPGAVCGGGPGAGSGREHDCGAVRGGEAVGAGAVADGGGRPSAEECGGAGQARARR